MTYPDASEPARVGSYPAVAAAGGGYVWDAVLEYRVWFSPARGADDLAGGGDYYFAFVTFADAQAASRERPGADQPLALVLQREYIEETEPGCYRHVREQRVTEWPVEFLARPKHDSRTIPDFLAPDAPANRLEILRGQSPRTT
ncbi:hypothetical protein [Virgisporangium aurantiacum]|uniref:GCN5 family acetyltransferase n=1 Tax=Virgisporangium aurantiacum TaxID=175570 RepID=A0A8J4E7Q5_9ACTN|nr:hypothetical protein [Virgisporangium aurantiacum]GIJ64811.1 hypothetical protein Vau01_123270 [Virgisporangium aurantiacum]